MPLSTIQFHPGPRVASIVLDRPPLNIINIEMLDELTAVWKEVEEIRAQIVIFSATGDRGFSGGVDIADHQPERVDQMLEKFHNLIVRIRRSDCISIAAIHGYTLGGGAELATTCDLVIAAEDAQIGFPEISVGCFPPVAAVDLQRTIGFHRACELVLLGEPIDAAEAHRMGLINGLVPRAKLDDTVDTYVDRLLTKSAAVLALAKRALREGTGDHFEEALHRSEALYLRELTKTSDMLEGIQSFMEKRPPSWKNK